VVSRQVPKELSEKLCLVAVGVDGALLGIPVASDSDAEGSSLMGEEGSLIGAFWLSSFAILLSCEIYCDFLT
jgi:hypothetical protein